MTATQTRLYRRYCRFSVRWVAMAGLAALASLPAVARAQTLNDIDLPPPATCFGLRSLVEPEALAVCAALNADRTIRARELAEQWLQEEPNLPAANYALAEVLLTVEGNVPRALYHLNRAEEESDIRSLDAMLSSSPQGEDEERRVSPLWHYLTLNQLSSVHQLVGNQTESLRYLTALENAYGVDLEPYKGWPLIKLGRFEEARQSALKVLAAEEVDRYAAAQAWNTLCAVELSAPQTSKGAPACDTALALDEDTLNAGDELSTVTLTNAAEVALSRLRIDQAETLIDRATRYPNPSSVANPWVQKLYLTLAQGRFSSAQLALTQMLGWRNRQDPLISVSNRAETYLASATLLLLSGYTEESARLAQSALNQPDRNGNFSAEDAQKDAVAALITALAYTADYEAQRERAAAQDGVTWLRLSGEAQWTRLAAWRASRRAASLFAQETTLRNRLRPYAPLDVHIPEWMEPEIVRLLGAGVFASVLDDADSVGVFAGAEGYRHSFATEVAALRQEPETVVRQAELALAQLPAAEILLHARLHWHHAEASWALKDFESARSHYSASLKLDPSLARRLASTLPVVLAYDGGERSDRLAQTLAASPRFTVSEEGLTLQIREGSLCLLDPTAAPLSCYAATPSDLANGPPQRAAETIVEFQRQLFGVGITLSKAQRSAIMGASVVLRAQSYGDTTGLPDF